MKNLTNVFLIGLIFGLSACKEESRVGASSFDEKTPSQPKATSPVPSGSNSSPLSFCVSHELRDAYSDPIPQFGSALYVALVHDGYTDRLADPKCLLSDAIVESGRTYIPCAVNIAAGTLYGRTWQAADRPWVQAAIEREADLANLKISGEIAVTVEHIDASNRFDSIAELRGKDAVIVSIDSSISFGGYCQ